MNKKTLAELVDTSAYLESALIESGGEINEYIEGILAEWEEDFASKVDGYAVIMERLKMSTDYWKQQAALMNDMAKSCEKVEARLKERLRWGMQEMNVDEVKGETYRFKLTATKPKVIVDDQEIIPMDHKIKEVLYKVDKSSILQKIKAGQNVPGAHIEENFSVRRYMVKKEQ